MGIAIWIINQEGKVLLQKERFEKTRIEIFQPIEAWVDSKEMVKDKIRRALEEELGKNFVAKYSFRQLSQIKKISFPIIGVGMATRYHFRYIITEQQSAIISSRKFRFIGKEDLPKIKKLSEQQKDPKEDIVLFKENQEILLGILGK